jgi:hypothetical protein
LHRLGAGSVLARVRLAPLEIGAVTPALLPRLRRQGLVRRAGFEAHHSGQQAGAQDLTGVRLRVLSRLLE